MNTIPWSLIEAALPTLEPVEGGYTRAQRGLVTLEGNQKVFVKIAVDEQTREWIQKERKAYTFLAKHDFSYVPRIISETDGGFAIADLSDWDWSKSWNTKKMDSVFQAMDALAELGSKAKNDFTVFDLDNQDWMNVPSDIAAYDWARPLVDPRQMSKLQQLIENKLLTKGYSELAATNPWAGSDLIHNDVRSDNFAFNPKTGEGLLIDLNWLCLSSKSFDAASLLVDMDQSGAEVSSYLKRTDSASLAYILGYWLSSAAIVPNNENLVNLRLHQLESALTAHDLIQRIIQK